MTSSAKYADILLPDCTASEQMDFALDASCGNMSYVILPIRPSSRVLNAKPSMR
jgi:anaerobic selenocysteine-containing dehydrogenase